MLLAPLGSGGSGRVWAAMRVGQLGFTKRMALKLLRHDKLGNSRAVQRFDREALLGARLSHPNIRAVHDLSSHEGWPYMAMRWVETSLEELLEHAPRHKLPPEVACWMGIQCTAALAAAHAQVNANGVASPIIHRDVAPGNILLSAEGHVLLSDLAAPLDSDGSLEISDTRFFGNIAYASPEALNERALDGRADVYSLGCVLYQCLSGAPPFVADNEQSILFQVLKQGAVDLAERAPEVPESVVAVVRRAMARDPDERFGSADAMGAALSTCVEPFQNFTLEERTTSVIREALGERMRAREEAMHVAFQRFSVSHSGRTDTLPIHQPHEVSARGADTQKSVAIAALLSSSSGGVVSPARRTRPEARRLGVLVGLIVLAGVVYLRVSQHSESNNPAAEGPQAATASPVPLAEAPREQTEQKSLQPSTPLVDQAKAEAPAAPSGQAPADSIVPAPAKPVPPAKSAPKKTPATSGKTTNAEQASGATTAAPNPPPTPRATVGSPTLQIERANPYKNRLRQPPVHNDPAAPATDSLTQK